MTFGIFSSGAYILMQKAILVWLTVLGAEVLTIPYAGGGRGGVSVDASVGKRVAAQP
jgi:hypothetical protein